MISDGIPDTVSVGPVLSTSNQPIAVGLDTSGLDPSFKSHAQRGIGRYVHELHRYLVSNSFGDVSVDTFDHNSLLRGGVGSWAIDLMPFGRTTLRQQFLYPMRLNADPMRRFSFVHFPAHMDAPAWSSKPFVLTVLDLIPLVLKELYQANRPGWRFRFARFLELRGIQQATVLLAISENTARDLERILNVPRDRIVVTPLGVEKTFFETFDKRKIVRATAGASDISNIFRNRLTIPLARPIILYVGGHDERKNIARLIEIGRRAIDALQNSSSESPLPVVVLAGRVNSDRERAVLADAITRWDMADHVVTLGYVPDADLQELYAESAVFLFPSLYEGFGLPVLEAMAAGVPVVSSNTSSMPEVVGEEGFLFDPTNIEQAVRGVLGCLPSSSSHSVSEDLIRRAHDRARTFTWENTGKKTVEAYRLAADRLAAPRSTVRGARLTQPKRQSGSRGSGLSFDGPAATVANVGRNSLRCRVDRRVDGTSPVTMCGNSDANVDSSVVGSDGSTTATQLGAGR